jgi:ureidoacrylate peracid hydrolase
MARPDDPFARLAPSESAFIVVDVQNDYADPAGALALAGADMSAVQEMVPRLERLLGSARSAGVFTIFTRNWHRPETDSEAWRERVGWAGPLEDRPGRAGTWGAAFYRVVPRDGEEVVSKFRYDAFLGTNLEYLLRARAIRTVVVAGSTTNVCVESTARAAHLRDFHLLLVGDCCASPEADLHAATLSNIDRYFGTVVTADEVSSWWLSGRARDAGIPRDIGVGQA